MCVFSCGRSKKSRSRSTRKTEKQEKKRDQKGQDGKSSSKDVRRAELAAALQAQLDKLYASLSFGLDFIFMFWVPTHPDFQFLFCCLSVCFVSFSLADSSSGSDSESSASSSDIESELDMFVF